MEESGVITFTISRTLKSGDAAPSSIYVSTTAGSADSEDYVEIDKQILSFAQQETSKTINVTTITDSLDEGREYFWLDVFKTYDEAAVGDFHAYDTGYIGDPTTVATEYTYSITSNSPANSMQVEGSSITLR